MITSLQTCNRKIPNNVSTQVSPTPVYVPPSYKKHPNPMLLKFYFLDSRSKLHQAVKRED